MDGTQGKSVKGVQVTLVCGQDQFLGERYIDT